MSNAVMSRAVDEAEAVDWESAPLEALEVQLSTWAAHIAAADAMWLQWLAVYDRREGWVTWGCKSAAHWLSWKCGMAPGTGREKVRVARALEALPSLASEFAAGRLSYSKVRAVTRVANPFNESDLVSMALSGSGAQLDSICAGYRRSTKDEKRDAAEAMAKRTAVFRDNHNGTTTLTLTVPTDAAETARSAIERQVDITIADATGSADTDGATSAYVTTKVANALASNGGPAGRASNDSDATGATLGRNAGKRRELIAERDGIGAMRADAAVALLTGTTSPSRPDLPVTSPADLTLIVSVGCPRDGETASANALTGGEHETLPSEGRVGGTNAPAEAFSPHDLADMVMAQINGRVIPTPAGLRLACDPRITALIENADRAPIGVGRTTRLISHKLRRALERRDRRTCRFPGCCSSRNLHAHHIIHWSQGGPTDLDNLILVCHFHHHLVHDGGWRVEPGTHQFIDPEGHAVDARPDVAKERSRGSATALRSETVKARCGGSAAALRAVSDAGPGHLEPEEFGPFDLGWATAVLHHNEMLRRDHQAATTTPT